MQLLPTFCQLNNTQCTWRTELTTTYSHFELQYQKENGNNPPKTNKTKITTTKKLWAELHESRLISHKRGRFWGKSRSSCSITPSHGFTSPSLCLPAVLATWAPPCRPPPLGHALPWRGRCCAAAGGSSPMPANTGTCVSHGGPPAGHGSTAHLLPVNWRQKREIDKRLWWTNKKMKMQLAEKGNVK